MVILKFKNRAQAGQIEKRFFYSKLNYRNADNEDEPRRVSGLGVVYDKEVELFPGYMESVVKDAYKESIEKERDRAIKSYFNHDPNQVLATTKSDPPLLIENRENGVFYDAEIPNTSYGNDLEANLERNNIEGSSYSFVVPEDGDEWWEDDEGIVHRKILKGEIFELGPVTDPAFLETPTNLRSAKKAYKNYQAQASKGNKSKLFIMRKKLEMKEKSII